MSVIKYPYVVERVKYRSKRNQRPRVRRLPVPRQQQFVPRTMGALAQTEMKYWDTFLTGTAISEAVSWAGAEIDPATYLSLFNPSEGADINGRIGRKVQVMRIAIRGLIHTNALQDQVDSVANPATRVILYMDQQTNGAQAQAETLMQTNEAAVNNVFCGFQNTANFGRFRVLRDITIRGRDSSPMTDGASTGSITAGDIPFKINYRFKQPVTVKFNATNGGTIADIVDNSFHLVAQKSGTGFVTLINYSARVYYKDL